MPSYHFEAAHKHTGRIERGLIDAENERNARQLLRARGLLPLALSATTRRRASLFRQAKLGDAERGWLTRQLASLLSAGLTLEAALTAALEQAERKPVAHLLAALRADIRAGHRLCDAMAAHPEDFPAIYRALIEAGEQSGELSLVMARLADYAESRDSLRNRVLTALIYPALVTVIAIAIVTFLLSHVVPQVVGAFSHTQQALPLSTRSLLALSDFLRHWGWALGLGITALLLGWRLALRQPAARLAWHTRLLRLPVVGRYVQGMNTERFAATLAILTDSGVPLLVALEASARTLTNDRLQAAANNAAQLVREGSSLATALLRQKTFPALLVHLVESGERTGELPAMLHHAGRTLSSELEHRILRLTAVLEPLLTVIMGGVVMFIVLAIMQPIIEINQLIQ